MNKYRSAEKISKALFRGYAGAKLETLSISRELYIHSFVLLSVKPSKSYLHMNSVVNLKMIWSFIFINLLNKYDIKYIITTTTSITAYG